ncbi:hypothetical protein ACER0C_024899 [Sarotherodon galilaeus]
MSSDLAENIGRAVLSAIQRFSGSAPSTSQTPQHLESSNAPGPSRPAVSTGIPYRSLHLSFPSPGPLCISYCKTIISQCQNSM